ncbi:MAG TPA: nitrate ABC transporter, permease protein, partial [Limnobacter sp.]|nr:nitrate ABC transporter, permease protein [Limnobacter sp.]
MMNTDTLERLHTAPKKKATPLVETRLFRQFQKQLGKVLPPIVIIGFLLLVWEIMCTGANARLPAPSKVITDTWDLIVNPFYNNGGTDVGMAWQILASLERVAMGYSMA